MLLGCPESLDTAVLNTKCTVCELLLLSIAVAVVSPPGDMLLVEDLVVLFRSLVPVASSMLRLVANFFSADASFLFGCCCC